MATTYYVSHSGQQMGPYPIDEIVGLVSEGTLSPLDYIFDESKQDWVLFMEHNLLADKVKELKPRTPPKPENKANKANKETEEASGYTGPKINLPYPLSEFMKLEWYALKGENKFGPFSYMDIVKMLQQSVIYEFDFAWHPQMDGWKRIAELEAFSKENIKKLKETAVPEINQVFFRRRHKRVAYGGTILIHDNRQVWKGQAVEISEGGAGVVMENSLVVPGQQLYLHFKPGDQVPPFNAVCEVVSKQYVGAVRDPKASVKYGLKFKTISEEVESVLKDFTKKNGVAKAA
jgi:hypothetical protein